MSYKYSIINLLALTEGLLLAFYIKHAQVSNNAKITSWPRGLKDKTPYSE